MAAGLLGSASADSTCVDPEALPVIESDLSVTGKTVWECKEVHLQASVTIQNGGELHIVQSIVHMEPDEDEAIQLRAASGAFLNVTHSTIQPGPGTDHAGSWVIESGAEADVTDSKFLSYVSFQIASSDVAFERVEMSGALATGLRIQDASPGFDSLEVDGGITAIQIEGESSPQFDSLEVGVDIPPILHAIRSQTSGDVLVHDSFLCSGDEAVFAEATGTLTLRRSGFCSGQPTHVRTASTAASTPMVRLEGTDTVASKLQRHGGAAIHVAWFVQVEVQNPDAQPGDLQGVKVVLRNATGSELAPRETPETGDPLAGPFLVPQRSFHAWGTVDHNDWEVLASKASSVGTTTLTVGSNREGAGAVPVEISLDPDSDPPVWDDPAQALAALQSPAGFSSDGVVDLQWEAADDTVDGAYPNRGIAYYQLSVTGPGVDDVRTETGTQATVTGLAEGTYRFKVRPVDLALNPAPSFSNEVTVVVDMTKPRVEVEANRTSDLTAGNYRAPFHITIDGEDDGSDVASLTYRFEGETESQAVVDPIPFTEDGAYNITVTATDGAGNANLTHWRFVLDRENPSIAAGLSPGLPEGQSGWYLNPPDLIATAFDYGDAGIAHIEYRIGSTSDWERLEGNAELGTQGEHPVEVAAVDRAGNRVESTLVLRLDSEAPDVTVTLNGPAGQRGWYTGPVSVAVTATDLGAGVETKEYRLGSGVWTEFQSPLELSFAGSQKLAIQASDRAGHSSAAYSATVAIDEDPPVPPVVEWHADEEGKVHANWRESPPLDIVSGISAIAMEQLSSDGTTVRSFTAPTDASSMAVGPFDVGTHRFRISVTDQAGLSAASATATVEVHTSVGGLSSAAEGATARDDVVLVFTPPAGFEPVEVSFYIDNELVAATATAPYDYEWDTRTYPDGKHTARIVARDASGAVVQEIAEYEVRNTWGNVVADHALPFGLATGSAVAAAAASIASLTLWRRWRIV